MRGSTVLHMHNPPDMLFLAGAMFRVARRKVVFDHHDLGPELTEVRFGSAVLEHVARAGERLTFAVADHVLAANESHSEIARKRGRMRSEQVTVVRNGPPASWTRLPLRIRSGRLAPVRLAYVGTIAKQDGVEGIAEVLACLSKRTPAFEVVLTVIGDGSARQAFEAALEKIGVAEKVTMTGRVGAACVPELLQEADICVDPAPTTRAQRALDDDQGDGVPGTRQARGRVRPAGDAADGTRRGAPGGRRGYRRPLRTESRGWPTTPHCGTGWRIAHASALAN